MACGRRLLRPVRIPIPPHPRDGWWCGSRGARGSRLSGRSWPLGPYGLESRLAAALEHDDLGRLLRLLGAGES